MSDINDDFINAVCEHVYGDEFNKYDTKNIIRNLKPAYDGTGILKFGTIKNSQYFLEFVLELWEQLEDLRDARRRYKKSLKTEKDYDLVCNQLNQEREDCKNKILEIREECDAIIKGDINNNPIYNKLNHDFKRLFYQYKELENKLENQDKLKQELIDAQLDKSNAEVRFKEFYQEKYNKNDKERIKEFSKKENELNTDKEKEIEKFKKDFVRQDDKICHMELKNELKLVKEENKKLKNQNNKFKKQLFEQMD
jgi:hypothetical protein